MRVMEASLEESAPVPASFEAEAPRDADLPALQQLSDVLDDLSDTSVPRPGTMVRCGVCGGWCHHDGQQDPARRHRQATSQRRGPRLPRAPPPPG